MHRAELDTPSSRGRASRSPRSRGRAFGIGVDAGFAIPDLPGLGPAAAGPRTTLEPASTAVLRKAWPSEGVERLLERVLPDGRLWLIVEHHETVGFHVWASRHRGHLVSPDATRAPSSATARRSRSQGPPARARAGSRHIWSPAEQRS